MPRTPGRPVVCTTPSGKVITFPSAYAAAKELDVDPAHIRRACRTGRRVSNCWWRYEEAR